MTGVGGKCHRAAASPAGPRSSGAMLEMTCQSSGAVTVSS